MHQRQIGSQPGVELIRHRPGSASLTQVIRVLPKRRNDDTAARIISFLCQAGYEVQGSYVPIHLLAQYPQCVWDRLPYAERIWADLVELPCEPTMRLDDVEKIAMIIKNCIEK
jgi:dTDP-4-amino-4,6-dideoxygalactose transaminase